MTSWKMFPDEREQALIVSLSVEDLGTGLIKSSPQGNLIAAAVYDLAMTVGDVDKAEKLLVFARQYLDEVSLRGAFRSVYFLRILKDGSSLEEEQPFWDFCESHNLFV